MGIANYCTLLIAALALVYGFLELVSKKSPWKEDEKYTEESASKLATIEGLIMVIGAICVAGLGLSLGGAVIDEKFQNIFIGIVIGLAVLDMLAAKAIRKLK